MLLERSNDGLYFMRLTEESNLISNSKELIDSFRDTRTFAKFKLFVLDLKNISIKAICSEFEHLPKELITRKQFRKITFFMRSIF